MERILSLDSGFIVFLLVMTLLFVLVGVILNSAEWAPFDYVTFW